MANADASDRRQLKQRIFDVLGAGTWQVKKLLTCAKREELIGTQLDTDELIGMIVKVAVTQKSSVDKVTGETRKFPNVQRFVPSE